MKKSKITLVAATALFLTSGIVHHAFAGYGGGNQTEANRLFQLEVEKARAKHAKQKKATAKGTPTLNFIADKKSGKTAR